MVRGSGDQESELRQTQGQHLKNVLRMGTIARNVFEAVDEKIESVSPVTTDPTLQVKDQPLIVSLVTQVASGSVLTMEDPGYLLREIHPQDGGIVPKPT